MDQPAPAPVVMSQEQLAALLQGLQPQGGGSRNHPKISTPTAPDPSVDHEGWKRAIDEWLVTFAHETEFNRSSYIKQSLPDALKKLCTDKVSIAEMGGADGHGMILKVVNATCGKTDLELSEEDIARFDDFRRGSSSFKQYVQEFERLRDRAKAVGETLSEKAAMIRLLHRAELAESTKAVIRQNLQTVQAATGNQPTYEHMKEQILALDKTLPKSTQVNVNATSQFDAEQREAGPTHRSRSRRDQVRYTPYNGQQFGKSRGKGSRSRSRTPQGSGGKGKGKSRPQFAPQQRSHSPRGNSPRSDSPRVAKCNRGSNCQFLKDGRCRFWHPPSDKSSEHNGPSGRQRSSSPRFGRADDPPSHRH